MKIGRLYKKLEKFFSKGKKDEEKREDLLNALDEKIASMKEKMKKSEDSNKKEELKKEIEALIEIKDKIVKE
ncbi:hypothetical protein KJ877_10330 [bacterium]|nr:hypothetical protein [bacterium]MBU1991112.1 hypothetical protein [bacterium]